MNVDTAVSDTVAALFGDVPLGDATVGLHEFGLAEYLVHEFEVALQQVFTCQGRVAARSNALSVVMASAIEPTTSSTTGSEVVLATNLPDGIGSNLERGGLIWCSGLALGVPDEGPFIVPVWTDRDASEMALALVASDRAGLSIEPINGIDPTLRALKIEATGVVPDELVASPLATEVWRKAVMWGRTALGFEIIGNARSALALAVDHARERVQFGQPIGAFQAVKHRLAESCIAIEAAEAALDSVLIVPSTLSAMVAKSMSGRAARVTATNALQVLGAMGFTAEHTFHHHQKRMAALDQLLGSADQLPDLIGSEILAEGHAPILVHLQTA
jgi:hypothetical protein